MASVTENRMFSNTSVTVTTQWTTNNPAIYIDHKIDTRCVDFAISTPASADMIAHFQFSNPLEAITAGHNMIDAGLDLARTLGIDVDELKSVTPQEWWPRGDKD